jgi:hypothetical protein
MNVLEVTTYTKVVNAIPTEVTIGLTAFIAYMGFSDVRNKNATALEPTIEHCL